MIFFLIERKLWLPLLFKSSVKSQICCLFFLIVSLKNVAFMTANLQAIFVWHLRLPVSCFEYLLLFEREWWRRAEMARTELKGYELPLILWMFPLLSDVAAEEVLPFFSWNTSSSNIWQRCENVAHDVFIIPQSTLVYWFYIFKAISCPRFKHVCQMLNDLWPTFIIPEQTS